MCGSLILVVHGCGVEVNGGKGEAFLSRNEDGQMLVVDRLSEIRDARDGCMDVW